MGLDVAELARIIDQRRQQPIETNVVDSMRDDLPMVERLAAISCVLSSPEISSERRAVLAKRYVCDDDVNVQRFAFSCDGVWSADSIGHLRALKCNSANEFYRLRALANAGDAHVLRECVRIIRTGEATSGDHPVNEAAMIAAELGTQEAVEFLRSLFNKVASGYSDRVAAAVAICLCRCSVADGVEYLEAKLDVMGNEMAILAAAALAVAKSVKGIERVERILSEGDEHEVCILRHFLPQLGVCVAQEADWQDRLREWMRDDDGDQII